MLRDLLTKINTTTLPQGWVAYAPLERSWAYEDWVHYIPWVLLAINFVGVFGATKLLRGPLHHHDPNDPTRLLLVTGFFGGFTSYSSLFVDFNEIWHHSIAGCLFVAFLAILSGVLAAELAMWRPRRHR